MNHEVALTLEEKRQIVYSSLYLYASEAVSLRHRAIQRVVLGALLGSNESEPFRIGHIQKNLCFGSFDLGIRSETIQEALDDLIKEGKVEHKPLRNRHAYYLTSSGEDSISKVTVSSEQLFCEVETYLFSNLEGTLSFKTACEIFRRFSFECFARFGRQIARSATGNINGEELINGIDAPSAFEAALNGVSLSVAQKESLGVRCQRFLTSSDPGCERLKFYLTQGYYFTQLVGLEHAKFNPLAEQAFSDAIFYLDTNVILVGLLYCEEDAHQFVETIRLAQRLGIEIRVSRASISEAQQVISMRVPQISKIVNTLPNELIEKTNDQVLMAFYQAKDIRPDLTPEEFFRSFDQLERRLKDEWNIEIDKRGSLEIIDGRDVQQIEAVLQDEAKKSRGWGKSSQVLEHDAAHYLAVMDERGTHPKTWFLTRDRTLEAVTTRLNPEELSFSFSHVGFLHSISPFVTSASEEMSLADVMSAFISDQIRPIGTLFDISELSLMAEFHEDVMSTPPDQLVMAFDYVKSRTLKGNRYRQEDIPKVSLELKKFLTTSRDERLLALQKERQRLAEENKDQRKLRANAEEDANQAILRGEELEEEVRILRNSLSETQIAMDGIKKNQATQERLVEIERQRNRLLIASGGVALGIGLLVGRLDLIITIANQSPALSGWQKLFDFLLRLVAALLMTIPLFFYIRNTRWRLDVQKLMFFLVSVLGLYFTKILSQNVLSEWSDLLGVGAVIASGFVTFMIAKKSENPL